MSILDDLAALGRPRFFDGQRLAAPDLQAVDGLNREMRWLHNQSLHQPGIGNGYAVTGAKGDATVVVGPGYALDVDGHEIVLTATRTLPIPPVAGEADGSAAVYDLTVSYVADAGLTASETRAADCGTDRGAVRLPEGPLFCWVYMQPNPIPGGDPVVADPTQQANVEQGRMIVLAQVQIQNCQLKADADTNVRRNARPMQQPYIACGQTNVTWGSKLLVPPPATPAPAAGGLAPSLSALSGGSTPRSDVRVIDAAGQPAPVLSPFVAPYVLTATVDTSGGLFRSRPQYTARIAYPTDEKRWIDLKGRTESPVRFFLLGIVNVLNPQVASFDAEVLLLVTPSASGDARAPEWPPMPNLGKPDKPGYVDWFKGWGVVWMGVEG